MPEQSKKTVDAVETACSILDALERTEGAGVTELAAEVGIAKSAVHSHLTTLRKMNYVVKEGTTYRLGLRYLSMAELVKDQLGVYDTAVDQVETIAEDSGEVSQFAVTEQNRLVYVERVDGPNAVDIRTDVGHQGMFHCTGLGKSILANLTREEITEIIDVHGLERRTENTVTDEEELLAEVRTVRERGYAIDDQEAIAGLTCVAAPVDIPGSETTGAVSVSGPTRRMDDDRIETELAPMVLRAANVIELEANIASEPA